MKNSEPRILVADDHSVVRSGIYRALGAKFPEAIVAEATNTNEVLKHLNESSWDLVILDISMPGRNGLDVLTEIATQYPGTKVIIFSMYPEDQYAVRTIKAGASAYVTKDKPLKELMEAIRTILQGERYLPASLAELLINEVNNRHQQSHTVLSDREYQVFMLIASGKPVSVIAEELSLSVKTISVYRANILKKMGLKNNAEITHYAFKHALVD